MGSGVWRQEKHSSNKTKVISISPNMSVNKAPPHRCKVAVKLNLIVLLFSYTVYCLKAMSQDFSALAVVQTEERKEEFMAQRVYIIIFNFWWRVKNNLNEAFRHKEKYFKKKHLAI